MENKKEIVKPLFLDDSIIRGYKLKENESVYSPYGYMCTLQELIQYREITDAESLLKALRDELTDFFRRNPYHEYDN